MLNYLEKLLFIEILEKVIRMRSFLLSEPDALRHQNKEVTSVFLNALKAIVQNLKPIMGRLSEEVALDENERWAIARSLSIVFNSVDNLHNHLQFTHGIWVRPETHVFLKSVLKFIPENRCPSSVNVILSNHYTFLETDLSAYIDDVLNPIHGDLNNKTPSVFLPKIEYGNPLNWAILVHECGHADNQDKRSIFEQLKIIPPNTDIHKKELIYSWFEEIYCDIFAVRILGPAYLASFSVIALLAAGIKESEALTDTTHPPDAVRINIIREVLKNSNLKVCLTEQICNFEDMSSLFFNIFEERMKLSRQYNEFPFELPDLQLALGEFVDEICEQVERIINLSQQLQEEHLARIGSLSQRLKKGILIGSYPNQIQPEIKESFINGRIKSDSLDIAKNAVQEQRVLLWEIVNAGWLNKIESLYPWAFKLFFGENDLKIEEKIKYLGEELEIVDRLLLKSIEASEIHRVMEEI